MIPLAIPPADWTAAVLLWSAVGTAVSCLLYKALNYRRSNR